MWTQYWPVYERLEKELCDFTFFVALVDDQLPAYSLKLAELILRVCSECENAAKTLAGQLGLPAPVGKTLQDLKFPGIGNVLCQGAALNTVAVDIVWPYQ